MYIEIDIIKKNKQSNISDNTNNDSFFMKKK